MSRALIAAVLVAVASQLSVLSFGDDSDPRATRTLSIGTLNLKDFYGGAEFGANRFKGVRPGMGIRPKPLEDQESIAAKLNEAQLQLLFVQELESAQVGRLYNGRLLDSKYMVLMDPGADPSKRNSAMLVDRSLPFEYVLENHSTFTWTPRPGGRAQRLFPRGLPVLLVYDPGAPANSKPRMIVIGTHNKAQIDRYKQGEGNRDAKRLADRQRALQYEKQAEVIAAYQAEFGPDVPIIELGDMQVTPKKEPKDLKNAGMRNVHDVSKVRLPKDQRITLRKGDRGVELDRILVNPALWDRVKSTEVIPLNGTDHALVKTEVEIPAVSGLPPPAVLKTASLPRVRIIPGKTTFATEETEGPTLIPTTNNDFLAATNSRHSTSLDIRIPTTVFQRQTDILSALIPELPLKFPEFNFSPIRRGLSSTVTDLGTLGLQEAAKLAKVMQNIPESELRAAGLLEPVSILDPNDVRVVITRTGSRSSLALKPSKEFENWQRRFSQVIRSHVLSAAPEAQFPGLDAEIREISIPLLEYDPRPGSSTIPEARIEEVRSKLETMIRTASSRVRPGSVAAEPPERIFDLSRNSVDLITRLRDGSQSTSLGFRFAPESGRLEPTRVMTWTGFLDMAKPGWRLKRVGVEFDTQKLLNGAIAPVNPGMPGQDFRIYNSLPQDTKKVWMPEFLESLPEPLRAAYSRESQKLGAGFAPLKVMGVTAGDTPLYLMNDHHPMIAPQKAEKVIPVLDRIGTPKGRNFTAGYAVYGSYGRSEFDRPSDIDLLMNANVTVPKSIRTQAAAEDYALKVFTEKVIGYFRKMAQEERLAFIEARIGSDATMDIPGNEADPLARFNENPYMSHDDIMRGYFVDKRTGRRWTLEELIRLGDFTKFKVDYFNPNGTREELSLQFIFGYDWNGHNYLLRRNGFKGAISSILPTAIYFGEPSYAVGAVMAPNVKLYASQFGDAAARSIGNVIESAKFPKGDAFVTSQPAWKAKVFKRFYGSLSFISHNSNPGSEQVFFEEMSRFLVKNGIVQDQASMAEVVQAIVTAINQPDLAPLNGIKRIANDLKEFNERGQALTEKQWLSRAAEFDREIVALERTFSGDRMPEELRVALQNARQVMEHARGLRSMEQVNGYLIEQNQPVRATGPAFAALEEALTHLEGRLIVDPSFSKSAIPLRSQEVVRMMMALEPHLYARFAEARTHMTPETRRLTYGMMGVSSSPEAQALMRETSAKLMDLTLEDLAGRQRRIFAPPGGPPVSPCDAGAITNALRGLSPGH